MATSTNILLSLGAILIGCLVLYLITRYENTGHTVDPLLEWLGVLAFLVVIGGFAAILATFMVSLES